MNKIAFLFPGQGSQTVGMAFDLYQEYDVVRELFDMAGEIARINLSKLCFKGPMEDLTQTVNLQPALTVVNLSFLAAIKRGGGQPDISAGHSLGEFSAMCASEVISAEDTLRLVIKRGELMHRESKKQVGTMHAIVGLSIDKIQSLVKEMRSEGSVCVANHNTETQIVISGAEDPVKRVSSQAALQGARVVPLKVSGAWHSDLMKGAEDEFKDFIFSLAFNEPKRSLLHNVTADFATDPEEIKSIMARHLCNPVKWYNSMQKLIEEKVFTFVEVGPGKVLTGLFKKIVPADYHCRIFNVNNMRSFERFMHDIT
ncbi:MAG: ACP S-malonyltransferase [Desulfobacterales bacterium]